VIRRPLLLDAGPLANLVHPRIDRGLADWFEGAVAAGATIVISEIADYEVRRKLLHKEFRQSLVRLDMFATSFSYLAIDTKTLRRAAELWADARRRGHPTAPPDALDGDVILAAQAEAIGAIVVSDNLDHLSQFVPTKRWTEIAF
jgi:predicted nucleic acid-binding protein